MSLAVSIQVVERCAECEGSVAHCHGVALVHVDGRSDCLDLDGCALPAEAHLFALSCEEPGCCSA